MPPDETSSQPSSTRPCANSATPCLSWTEISARGTGPSTTSGSSRCSTACSRSTQRLARLDRQRLLPQHGPGVDALVDEMHGHAGLDGACRERVVDRVGAGKRRQERRMDVHDPRREAVEERASSGGACSRRARRARRRAPRARSPSSGRAPRGRRGSRGRTWPPEARPRGRGSGRRRRLRFAATAADRQPGVDQRLQVRAVAADEHADHAARSARSRALPAAGSATTAHQPIPRLKTRRSSSSSTWRASQPKTGGRSQASQSISARSPAGRTRATGCRGRRRR